MSKKGTLKNGCSHNNYAVAGIIVCSIVAIVLVVGVEFLLRRCNTILPICIPWMDDYYWIYILSFALTLIRKYLLKSKKGFVDMWLKSLILFAVIIIVIPASVLLPNKYFGVRKEMSVRGIVIETEQASSGAPSKAHHQSECWLKIKLSEEDAYFWYDHGKNPPLSTRCILSVKKGLFGLRYADNVDFLIE